MGVKLVLWLLRMLMVETLEGIQDLGEHGEMNLALWVVPIEVKAQVAFASSFT